MGQAFLFYVCIVTAPSDSLFNLCGVLAKLLSFIAGDEIIPADCWQYPSGGVQGRAPVFACPLSGRTIPSTTAHPMHPLPAPLALNPSQGREGARRSSSPLQESCTTVRLIIDLRSCIAS